MDLLQCFEELGFCVVIVDAPIVQFELVKSAVKA